MTTNQDGFDGKQTILYFGDVWVRDRDARSIVDNLRRQLAEVTSERDELRHLQSELANTKSKLRRTNRELGDMEADRDQAREQLATAAAFVDACGNRISYGGAYDDVRGDYSIHVAFRNRKEAMVARDKLEQLLKGTAGRDMLDEMRRKDAEIADRDMKINQQKTSLREMHRGCETYRHTIKRLRDRIAKKDERIAELERQVKAQKPTPEPVYWRMAEDQQVIWRCLDGKRLEVNVDGGEWSL
jgi:septal ring factor EnvC (AmiA/AmiB activator)